jgi:hypothetical protein
VFYIIRPEYIYAFTGFVATAVGLWNAFSIKITAQEKRLVILEKDVETLNEFKQTALKRMNNHDKQNEALIRLTTNIENLTEKVEAINEKMEKIK